MSTIIRKETSQREGHDFPAIMTKHTLAELLGVSPRTITEWTTKGLLKTFRPTQRVTRFRRADVVSFLERWTA